ncbi:MAG: hypothetical protein R2838_12695 [Caldilineaceae bacterium]
MLRRCSSRCSSASRDLAAHGRRLVHGGPSGALEPAQPDVGRRRRHLDDFPAEDLVGRLTVNTNGDDFTASSPPTANSEPYDLVYHDGTVWFTLKAGNRLARLDTNDLESGISEFVLPTASVNRPGWQSAATGVSGCWHKGEQSRRL